MKDDMREQKQRFLPESLQDAETIQRILKVLTKGLARGELSFSDEDGEIVMRPHGLLALKVTAAKEDGRNRVAVRITWQDAEREKKGKKSMKVS